MSSLLVSGMTGRNVRPAFGHAISVNPGDYFPGAWAFRSLAETSCFCGAAAAFCQGSQNVPCGQLGAGVEPGGHSCPQ